MQFQNEISSPASKHIFRPKFSGFFFIFFETGQKKNSNSFEIRQIFKKKKGAKKVPKFQRFWFFWPPPAKITMLRLLTLTTTAPSLMHG